MKFAIVAHSWHVYSQGFKVFEVNVESKNAAEKEAKVLQAELSKPFNAVAVHVIPIGCTETVVKKKLTLAERFKGLCDFPPAERSCE